MAECPSSTLALDSNPKQPEPDKPNLTAQSDQLPPPPPLSTLQQQQQSPVSVNPTSNPPLVSPLPSFPSYVPPTMSAPIGVPPSAPSFRTVPLPTPPQFSPLPSYQNHAVQPPGVSSAQPMMSGGDAAGAVSMAPPQMMQYQLQVPPGQPHNPAMRHYAPVPNGYAHAPLGTMHHPGLRYPAPYMSMVRPGFSPRPPGAVGMIPGVPRPLISGVPGARPINPPVIRPAVLPIVTHAEKPQTTVYVGKIASTVENDFMLHLLQFCGPVKSWKRSENPTNGTPLGFGFCEFGSAEGVLRALRLLNKFNIDGQELMLNVNQATREYLERYVDKKTENWKKLKEAQDAGAEKEDENSSGAEKNEPSKSSDVEAKKDDNDSGNKENQDISNFGIVTDADRVADKEALEKLANKIEERLKTRPLPPPPPLPPVDGSGVSNAELPAKSRDGDTDMDIMREDAAKDRNGDEMTSDKPSSEQDRPETSSPDRSRRNDRRSRDRDRDIKREKEREIERYEKEADRERIRKERDQRRKIEDAEREYADCLKQWEYRESKRERQRQYEKEREKERERKRKREIYDEEEEEDSRKRGRRNEPEEKRKRRLREWEEDLADRQREEEEIAEAKKMAEEELKKQEERQKDALKLLSSRVINGSEKTIFPQELNVESKDKAVEQDYEGASDHENHIGDGSSQNGIVDDSNKATSAASDTNRGVNAPATAKKLGFGLVGSGKKTAVPSVFHEEDDEDAQKEKRMRPLVPIDYSTEELQAVQPAVSGAQPPNLAAAAEFAKRISNVNSKEEKHDQERERGRRSHERSSQRDRDRNAEDINRNKDDNKEKVLDRDREHGVEKVKTPDNKKLLDAKQLIDMIPKTKEELFSYEINWAVYDKHELHERMRPWISKKIMEFLGEEEPTLVNYIVSSTQEHVKASQMLELLQSILDEEAEMFVLKMWRMLIFEIKKVETGLSLRSRT